MPSQRENMEVWEIGSLFDSLANLPQGHNQHDSAVAELARRRFVSQDKVDAAQIAAATAQIDSSEYTKQSVKAVRQTVWWTAVAAIFTALAAMGTLWAAFHR
ncbi:hypothetical protein [Methylocella sp.]|jgi:hypothetical protein|uniref:hypothetical protein n=1 Tax=Methylocella sp. TaxID=1978226 RepID=UPI003C20FBC5